jgi:hypothetical protein
VKFKHKMVEMRDDERGNVEKEEWAREAVVA